MTDKEASIRASDRAAVAGLLKRCGREAVLGRSVADLPLLQSLLSEPLCYSAGSSMLASMGTAFGDVLADEMGLHWAMVTDELGSDHALQVPGKAVFVFPRSMLLKRAGGGVALGEISLDFMLDELSKVIQVKLEKAAHK